MEETFRFYSKMFKGQKVNGGCQKGPTADYDTATTFLQVANWTIDVETSPTHQRGNKRSGDV